jgi:hypothetical protein
VESRLRTDERLDRALGEHRSTAEPIGTLPQVAIPRNFTLGPEHAPQRGGFPLLQFSAALATLSFVVLVGAAKAMAPSDEVAEATSPEEALDEVAVEPAPDETLDEAPIAPAVGQAERAAQRTNGCLVGPEPQGQSASGMLFS